VLSFTVPKHDGPKNLKMGHVIMTTPIFGSLHSRLILDTTYLCTKSEDSSLTRSIDMMGTTNLKWATQPWPRPFCHHKVKNWYDLPLYKIWRLRLQPFQTYGDAKSKNKCDLGWLGSLDVIGNVTIWYSAYNFLFTFHNKNSSGDEIANVNFYAVRPWATRIRWNNAK